MTHHGAAFVEKKALLPQNKRGFQELLLNPLLFHGSSFQSAFNESHICVFTFLCSILW